MGRFRYRRLDASHTFFKSLSYLEMKTESVTRVAGIESCEWRGRALRIPFNKGTGPGLRFNFVEESEERLTGVVGLRLTYK